MPKTLNYGDKFLSDKKSNSMTNSNSVLHKVREQLKKEKEQDRIKREKMLSDHINKRKIQLLQIIITYSLIQIQPIS
jgi:hypothetical protein